MKKWRQETKLPLIKFFHPRHKEQVSADPLSRHRARADRALPQRREPLEGLGNLPGADGGDPDQGRAQQVAGERNQQRGLCELGTRVGQPGLSDVQGRKGEEGAGISSVLLMRKYTRYIPWTSTGELLTTGIIRSLILCMVIL